MSNTSGLFDEMARMMSGAMGMAQGLQGEARTFMRAQADKLVADMDLVSREEFEAVKDMAAAARMEANELRKRVAALEAVLSKRDAS